MKTTENNQRLAPSIGTAIITPHRNLLLTVLCSLGLLLSSCGSDSSTGPGDNGGNGNGDDPPDEPTYANVQSIFNSSCGGSGCHIGEQRSGVQLDSHDNIMNSVGDQYGENVVQPGDADGSPLVDKIESSSPEEGVRMPQGGPYLSDSEINLIKEWIDNGAEENENSGNDGGNGDY